MYKKLLLALALCAPLSAEAVTHKFARIDTTDEKTTLKGAKKLGFKLQGKPKSAVKKVAVVGFQVRYNFEAPQAVKHSMLTGVTTTRWASLQVSPDAYHELTDLLYGQFVAYLQSEGFEVVDSAAVLGSPAYAGIETGDEKEKNEWARYAPTGFSLLPMYAGRPTSKHGGIAAVTEATGADASVAVALNVGLCDFQGTAKWREGITDQRVCLIGPNKLWESAIPALNIEWYGGHEQGSKGVDEAWHARLYKFHDIWQDKRTGAVYDPPVVLSDAEIAAYAPKAQTGALGGEVAAYAVQVEATFDRALTGAFAVWGDKVGP